VKVEAEKREKIIEGRYQYICEILSKLFDFDNSGGQLKLAEGNSETRDESSNGRLKNNDSTNISVDGKDLLVKVGKLDALSPNILGNARKSKLPPNISPNVRKVKPQVNQSVTSLNDLSDQKELSDAETTLEFILLGLARNLGIKPKQAAGLLSNNHKYLIHIAVKGMKGSDYSKIQAWYQNVYGHARHLATLIDNEKEQNAMKLTLNILKCGLYSLNAELVITCTRVLSRMGQEINQIGGVLAGYALDWFVDNS
jgi:hypothetical protein